MASFSNKIGGSGKDLATLLAAVLTWSGYWNLTKGPKGSHRCHSGSAIAIAPIATCKQCGSGTLECSTWHKFPNPGPRGRHFYQKCHISKPGGTILIKNVLFPTQGPGFWSNMSYLQPRARGHNFNQKCHIANTCGDLWYDFGQIHHKIHFKYLVWYLLLFKVFK